jgi:hypothetical protein
MRADGTAPVQPQTVGGLITNDIAAQSSLNILRVVVALAEQGLITGGPTEVGGARRPAAAPDRPA